MQDSSAFIDQLQKNFSQINKLVNWDLFFGAQPIKLPFGNETIQAFIETQFKLSKARLALDKKSSVDSEDSKSNQNS